MNTIVIDTNIIISALIKDSITRKILIDSKINFLFPEFGVDEIYLNKLDIIQKAKITEKEFDILLLRILKYLRLIPLNLIINFKDEADKIIGNIHKNDAIFIATALAFNCPIWTDDKHFQKQNKIKIFTTKDMLEILD